MTVAGGCVTNRQGRTALDGGFIIAAGSQQLHSQVLDQLN